MIPVSVCQMRVVASKEENLKRAREMIKEAAKRGARLVILPEMFNCPYESSLFPAYAEEIPHGRTTSSLQEIAAQEKIILCSGSIPERGEDGVYNTSLLIDEEGHILMKHRKMHLFDIDVPGGITFRESDTLKAGNGLEVVSTSICKMGLAICYDIRFPETIRILALKGAHLILIPGAFNMVTGPPHWKLLLRCRALDNQVFLIGAAPARDEEGPYVAYGHSLVVDPWGDVLKEGGSDQEILEASLDLKRIDSVRRNLPLLSHRREDLYQINFDS